MIKKTVVKRTSKKTSKKKRGKGVKGVKIDKITFYSDYLVDDKEELIRNVKKNYLDSWIKINDAYYN